METRTLQWTAEEDALLGTDEIALVAVVVGRPVREVQKRMRKLGVPDFVPPSERKPAAPGKALRASPALDEAIAVASCVGMGQTVLAAARKLGIKTATARRHLAYFMEIVRDYDRLGDTIPAHWEEAEKTAPGLLNAAALRLSMEVESGALWPWTRPLPVTRAPSPYIAPTLV
ncbi:hypothetical protein F1090_22430 [Salmonella enterica]|nr:hypothetical protein [Salmonella enterica]HDV3697345.1 hypothetical protein [Escherichia coli]